MLIKYYKVSFIFVLLFIGCGYRSYEIKDLQINSTNFVVVMFENTTEEEGIEGIFTNDLIDICTLNFSKEINKKKASVILRGKIISLYSEDIENSYNYVFSKRRIVVVANAKLFETTSSKLLWSSGNIRETYDYFVLHGDILGTQRNMMIAISKISKKISESIFYELIENF